MLFGLELHGKPDSAQNFAVMMTEHANCAKYANRSPLSLEHQLFTAVHIGSNEDPQWPKRSSPGRSPYRVTQMQEGMFPTWQERRGHVQIALMWKSPQAGCGWVGRDREMREILDLLCSERWVISPPPICPDFCFYLFCWHAFRNIVGPQVTVLAGLGWCSVLHWSNFRMHHPLP